MKNPARIIVDANVMLSAAPFSNVDESKRCALILSGIENKKLKVVEDDFLFEEWNRHWSSWSISWYARMVDKDLIHKPDNLIIDRTRTQLDANIDGLHRLDADDGDKAAMKKDSHLMASSQIAGSWRVISKEKRCLRLYKKSYVKIAVFIGKVVWVCPNTQFDACNDWISKGAPLSYALLPNIKDI